MTIINDNTVVVFSFEELKNILEGTNTYNYIYFGSNISLTSGIKIASTKTSITIDGKYNNEIYTLEDRKSLNASDTINVAYQTINKVTVKNMNIIGNNYYGIIYVPESQTYKNITIEYNNVNYNGPQISFNPNGLTRFIDSSITIKDTALTVGNEVAECNKIELGGTTTINHTSKSNSTFWFRNENPSFTILTNSNVKVTSESRELFYGPNNLTFSIMNSANISIITHSGMGYATNGTGTTVIEENASLSLTQTTYNGSYSAWYSYGTITLNNNASLIIINNYPKITTSNYNISFLTSNSGFILNNPKKVILYNTAANIINTNSTIPFKFQYSRINLFTNSISIEENITKTTLPTYSWYKEQSLSVINGTFTKSTTNILESNYTEDELKSLPSLDNFNFPTKKILSIGSLPLRINALTDADTEIIGVTQPLSSILIQYNDIAETVVADDTGNFTYNMETTLPIGTNIIFTAKEYNDLIYQTKNIQIIYPGELTIDNATNIITFNLNPISKDPLLCPKNKPLIINVTDSRVNSNTWNLYASIKSELTSTEGNTLNRSLVFIDKNNVIKTLSSEKTLIYTGTANDGKIKTTTITWNESEGILLQINNPLINNNEYKTNIDWNIE